MASSLMKRLERVEKRVKADPAGKRIPLMVRTTVGTRERLEALAAASGRSLAQEAEILMDRAMRSDELRTIIREEIEADRERQRKREEVVAYGPRLNALGTNYGRSLSYLNGEPKTDH